MIVTLQHLIETLRNELQQYGEMLALLDHQQELAGQQAADDLLRSISAIDTQIAAIQLEAAIERHRPAEEEAARGRQRCVDGLLGNRSHLSDAALTGERLAVGQSCWVATALYIAGQGALRRRDAVHAALILSMKCGADEATVPRLVLFIAGMLHRLRRPHESRDRHFCHGGRYAEHHVADLSE